MKKKKQTEEIEIQVQEAPEEKVAEEPAEAPVEVPAEASAEAPVEVPVEAPAEATAEAPVEVPVEASAETLAEASDEEKISKKKGWLIALIIVSVLLCAVVGAYFFVANYYENRFFMRTSVNGLDCSGMTIDEVEALMQSQVEEYTLVIHGRNGMQETIKGTDFGIQYNGVDVLEDALAGQNSYYWVKGLLDDRNICANISITYDQEKLDEVIAGLECVKPENQVAPVSAKPIYTGSVYEIQEESQGAQIDVESLKAVLHASAAAFEDSVDLDVTDCYVKPIYTKESAEVIAAKDALNRCLQTDITYNIENVLTHVNAATVAPWISVDSELNLVIDEKQVRSFVQTLSEKYNTPDVIEQITTPTGKTTLVPGGRLGRVVGVDAECKKLLGEIKEGKKVTREPVLSQHATKGDGLSWGTTYIEVDITAQHMWYIVDGAVVFESEVVTGSPGRDTPAGKFQILEKKQNKTLLGNMRPDGTREYETPVKYWARITWSGVGFHDATWQAGFGGNRYKEGYGSHGCINMPLSAIEQLYGMIEKGTAVVIHY